MNDKDLGPQPDPVTEDPELYPGGADAVEPAAEDNGLGRDLDPDANPAVDDVLPEGVSEPDEKSQAPEGKADDAEAGTDGDPDAGQTAEDGSTEPPA
ncbi:hypothetical protein [Nocardioides piscis]|uniref:Uncharacterized protein n=1 Tax=Nocardioides piscis TaxID=2714938 RepID=A0A6G7YCH4_9ACTN|nr:hypothetical protein [Nocardioides piscis]QIK74376.1 hypothetical protein G7071_01900 [Nocardioides piscis]